LIELGRISSVDGLGIAPLLFSDGRGLLYAQLHQLLLNWPGSKKRRQDEEAGGDASVRPSKQDQIQLVLLSGPAGDRAPSDRRTVALAGAQNHATPGSPNVRTVK
jgi:hypothetical protein